ncbi:MAG: hypothetical protein FD134_2454 [Gallionellaceae bacterium]|nr:MAG: hypothetical protein FD134_2454 [Gallionellaceae bacterium]
MLTLPLEPTDDRANPAFKDAASCTQWLGQLQLTNLHAAHGVLRKQIEEFNRYPMRGLERLHTLELLRETVSSVQGDYAKKLIAKKLPLATDELAVFFSIVSLWQGLATGYQRCLQAFTAGEPQLSAFGALLCQRCLLYGGLQIYEYLCAGYEFDGTLWHRLHALYKFAEGRDLHLAKVDSNPGGGSGTTTCRAVYVKLLLASYAHRADMTRGQLQMLDRWLSLWCEDITVERSFTRSRGDAPPLAVDLESSLGLQPLQHIGQSVDARYLAMVPLSKLLRVKVILLQQGQSPQQQELGEGWGKTECIAFLNFLLQRWCEGRSEHPTRSRAEQLRAEACYGMESCYAHIASKPFRQPGKDFAVDTISRKQIEAFGRVLSDTDRHDLSEMGHTLESWSMLDDSMLGAQMLREAGSGARLGPNQLTAVRAASATIFVLGAVSWVTVAQTGQLRAGIRYFPGSPQPVAMKATGVNLTVSDKHVAALLLPAMDALKIPASLIAPRDWFKPGRVVEIVLPDKQKQNIRMDFSVEKGLDYERISFTQV